MKVEGFNNVELLKYQMGKEKKEADRFASTLQERLSNHKTGHVQERPGDTYEKTETSYSTNSGVYSYDGNMLNSEGRIPKALQREKDTYALEEEEEEKSTSDTTEDSDTNSEIIVKPDGSRILVVNMSIGGRQSTMSIEISKPTGLPNGDGQIKEEEAQANSIGAAAFEMEIEE